MRLKLLLTVALAAAVMGTTSALFEVETASLVPLLTQIPFVEDFITLSETLGLPSPLELLPETLFTQEQFWGKVGYGLAATGVGIIEIASFIGYIFNYLDKIEKVNLEQREEEAELAEAIEAGEAEPPVMERYSAILPFSEGEKKGGERRIGNRRVASEHDYRPRPRRPVRPPIQPLMPTSRPYPSRIHRRRMLIKRPTAAPLVNGVVEGRAAAAVTPAEGGEGVMGLLAHTGNVVLEVLKKFFLKEVEAGAVGWEMKELLEEAADSLTEVLMQQLDPYGCLQKLLCHLQERSSSSLTPEEGVLTTVFSLRRQHAQCTEDHFPQCVLSVEHLEELLPPATSRKTSAIP